MNTKLDVLAFGLSLLGLAACHSTTPAVSTTTPQPETSDAPHCPTHETCAWNRGRVERLPVLVLEEHGGWEQTKYPASGTPTFALYDDGLVLFVEGTGDATRVRQAELTKAEVDTLVRRAHEKLAGLPEQIEGSSATDQPGVTIRVQTRGPTRDVFAWGIDREGKATDASRTIPAAFVELYAALRGFHRDDAEPWTPDEIAIRLHPLERGDGDGSWPAAVPLPPESASASQTQLIYRVDGDLEDEVLDALVGRGDPPVVHWAGKPWAMHVSRVVPG